MSSGDFQTYFHTRANRFAAFYSSEPVARVLGRGPLFDRLRLAVDTTVALGAKRVLDVGCGSGPLFAPLAAAGIHVTGIDPAEAMIALARQQAAVCPGLVEVEQRGWEQLTEVDTYDVAVALGVFDYIAEPAELLGRMGRAAGHVVASFPSPGLRLSLRKLRYGAHGVGVHGYAALGFGRLASDSGMEVVDVVPLGRAGYFVHFRRRTGARGMTGRDARFEPALVGSVETGKAASRSATCSEHGTRRRLVLHVLPCDIARGAQVFARDLRALLDGGCDDHRILTLFRAPPAVLQADSSLEVPMGGLRSLGFDPRVVVRLRRVLDTLRPDVVVAHGGEPLKYLVWANRGDTPLVYFAIGTTTEAARHGARRVLYRVLLSRADAVAGVSVETLEEAERVFGVPPTRTVLLPNGRDPQLFRPREEVAHGADAVSLVFVGHLTTTKRPFRFLAAVDELRRRGLGVRGVVVGDGPLENEVRGAASLSGCVEVLGRRDDVPALLRAADVFVFTSVPESEGMPGVLIEAALSGLPTVATAVPGASTVIADGVSGFVVAPEDDEALLDALEQLVTNDELRHAMGAVARERTVAAFSLEESARSWQAFLDRIAPHDRALRTAG
jgi:glycosyltransferase involved in cell wall biosynthesis